MTATELIDRLVVIDENVTAEAAGLAALFVDCARYRVAMMRKRAGIGAELEYTRSKIARDIRNKKYSERKDKPTEAAIKERIDRHPDVRNLRTKSDDAYAREELAKLLLEAVRHRKFGIEAILDMQRYEANREGAEIERKELHRKMVNRARDLMGKARRGSS